MRRGLGPGHYAVLAAGLTATAWLVARAGGLPGKWLPPTALAVLLLGLTYRLLLPYLQREAVAGRIARRELAARRDELQALRATLRAAHLAYRAEALRAAAEQLRGEEVVAADSLAALTVGQRRLQLEGPDSAAWLGLARTWLALGRVESALCCAAEAIRAGLAEPALLRQIAEVGRGSPHLAGEGASQAELVIDCFRARELDARRLAAVYEQLGEWRAPRVVQLVLWREILQQLGDREEVTRRTERLMLAPPSEEERLAGLYDAWTGYRAAWSGQVQRAASTPPEWTREVPAPWRELLGLAPPAATRRYRDALPAQRPHEASHPAGLPRDQGPAGLRVAMAAQLWPRSRRSRGVLLATLREVGGLADQALRAAGLETLALALAEERDPGLDSLTRELVSIAQGVGGQVPRVKALAAAGLALEARDEQGAQACWKLAVESAAALDDEARRALLGDLPVSWRKLGRPGARWLIESLPLLLDSSPEMLLPPLLTLTANAPWETLATLRDHRDRLPPLGRYLVAWQQREFAALVDSLAAIWGAGEGAAWLPLAAVGLAEPGDEAALREGIELLRREAPRDGAAAGWLAWAHRLDQLEERPTWPAALRALAYVAKLPPGGLATCLGALQLTLATATPAWIDAVELAFLRRTARPRGLAAAEARVELESLNRLLTWLGPARLATRQRAWMGAYQDRLATWSEHLLEPAASR